MATINIEIEKGGATTMKVVGHAGPGCKSLTKAIEDALGTVTQDVKTPEFNQQAKQTQAAKASN